MTTLASIHARQGVTLDDESYDAAKEARRIKNVENAREVLNRNKIDYGERPTLLDPPMFIVQMIDENYAIKYHPATGVWYDVDGVRNFGVRNLVRYLKGSVI